MELEHQFWSKIRNSPPLDQNPLPSLPQSIKQKSELFANHFENAFTNPKITKPINKPFNYYKSKRYNQPITPKELNTAIRKTTNSTSTDNITNKFIKNLGDPAKSLLLYLFNASLILHYVPSQWKTATIILIPKNDNDPNLTKSYRPIALLSCLGKVLERIINTRLTHWTKFNRLLAPEQSGIVTITLPKTSFSNLQKQQNSTSKTIKIIGAILCEDTTPHSLILKKLQRLKCPVTLAKWLRFYLSNRSFQIKIGNTQSTTRQIQAGIPQGGCISAFLFAIFINDISRKLRKIGVHFALFADDISVWHNSRNLNKISNKLQKATNLIQQYASKWGMKLNTNKTNYIVFHKKYRTNFNQHNLKLTLNNKPINKSPNPTLLGITLDKHLNFDYHFHSLIKKLTTKINLISHLSSRTYSINPKYLLTIYKATILSKIQYSMLPYQVTSTRTQNKLQLIQNQILRRILNVHSKTSIKLIHTITNMPTINQHLTNLTIKFISKARTNKNTNITNLLNNFNPPTTARDRSILKNLWPTAQIKPHIDK